LYLAAQSSAADRDNQWGDPAGDKSAGRAVTNVGANARPDL
jgi:hypothetical protein